MKGIDMKWEYCSLNTWGGKLEILYYTDDRKLSINNQPVSSVIAKLGTKGWELAGILKAETANPTYLFKRPVEIPEKKQETPRGNFSDWAK
jgi:hypothetical protein